MGVWVGLVDFGLQVPQQSAKSFLRIYTLRFVSLTLHPPLL